MTDQNDPRTDAPRCSQLVSSIRFFLFVGACFLHVGLGTFLMWKRVITPVTCFMFIAAAACFIIAALPDLMRRR